LRIEDLDLNDYERIVAEEVLDPAHIEGGFDTVGGMEEKKREVSRMLKKHHCCWSSGLGVTQPGLTTIPSSCPSPFSPSPSSFRFMSWQYYHSSVLIFSTFQGDCLLHLKACYSMEHQAQGRPCWQKLLPKVSKVVIV